MESEVVDKVSDYYIHADGMYYTVTADWVGMDDYGNLSFCLGRDGVAKFHRWDNYVRVYDGQST